MEFQNVKKILIFKLCCLGDTVFMTPTIHSLKKTFPAAKIYYAYSKWIEPMMKYIPELDGSILFEDVYDKSIFTRIRGALKFIRFIRKEKFDLVLNGHRSSRLSLILALCHIPYRLGFSGTKFLTHTAPFRSSLKEYLRYGEILSKNNIPVQNVTPYLKKPEILENRLKLGVMPGDKIIGIFPNAGSNPGTQMSIKKWDKEKYFELTSMINQGLPEMKVLIFEGKLDHEKFEIPKNLKAEKSVIDNDLLACCDIFISADTGSLHIAAGFGVSTISIFGPTDPRLLAPVNSLENEAEHRYIWKKSACSPCYTPETAIDKANPSYWNGDNFICRFGTNVCMKSVEAVEVFNTLEKILEYSEELH